MANPFNNSTRFNSRCRKAGLLLLALGLATLCALFAPANGQSVQAMVKNQPFPYAQGVAMDTLLYKAVKAKLQAAESLRLNSSERISALEAEITGMQTLLADQQKLGQYDALKADSLTQLTGDLTWELGKAKGALEQAQRTMNEVVRELPKRIQKKVVNASAAEVSTIVTDYIDVLQARKWKWAGVSTLIGGVGSLVTLLLLR
jgi:hypothetical protein